MDAVLNCHMVGPFTQANTITMPSENGFIMNPSDTASSPGWGFPIYPNDDATQTRIFPGTYGADGQYSILRKVKGKWKESKYLKMQSMGNISWWGPEIPVLPEVLNDAAKALKAAADKARDEATTKDRDAAIAKENAKQKVEDEKVATIVAHNAVVYEDYCKKQVAAMANSGAAAVAEAAYNYSVAQAVNIAKAAELQKAIQDTKKAADDSTKADEAYTKAEEAAAKAEAEAFAALPAVRRNVLSYWGPTTRLFPDAFEYSPSGNHLKIYKGGGIVGIAPGAVLGASLIKMIKEDADKYSATYWLVAICLEGSKTKVYRRPLESVLIEANLTDEAIKALKAKYDEQKAPKGWALLCEVSGLEKFDKPRRPWFFSEDGTKATSLYSKDKTHVPCDGDAAITQKEWNIFRVVIAGGAATSTTEPNLEMYKVVETGTITIKPDWTTPADPLGYTHKFEEMAVKSEMIVTGEQIVAVDYVKNEEVLIKFKITSKEGFQKDYMHGVDPDTYGSNGIPNNRGAYWNVLYIDADGLPLGATKPLVPGGHTDSTWLITGTLGELVFTIDKVDYQIVMEINYGGWKNPITHVLVVKDYYLFYVRHLDIRTQIGFFYLLSENTNLTVSPTKTYDRRSEIVVTNMKQGFGMYGGSYTYDAFATNGDNDIRTTILQTGTMMYSEPTTWQIVKDIPSDKRTWSWTYRTLTGERPTRNDAEEKFKWGSAYNVIAVRHYTPGVRTSLNEPQYPMMVKGLRGLTVLSHKYATGSQGFGVFPSKEYVSNMYVPDPTKKDGTLKLFTKCSTGLDATTLSGGKKLYPIGIF